MFCCIHSPHAPAQGLHPAITHSPLTLHDRSDHVSYLDLPGSSPHYRYSTYPRSSIPSFLSNCPAYPSPCRHPPWMLGTVSAHCSSRQQPHSLAQQVRTCLAPIPDLAASTSLEHHVWLENMACRPRQKKQRKQEWPGSPFSVECFQKKLNIVTLFYKTWKKTV